VLKFFKDWLLRWKLRRIARQLPVIDKLPDDPEWEKKEQDLAKHFSGQFPPPDFD